MNVTSIEVELFAIRYRINQTIQMQNVVYIIVITDAIPAAKQIFDISNHPYQLYSIIIFSDLRKFLL